MRKPRVGETLFEKYMRLVETMPNKFYQETFRSRLIGKFIELHPETVDEIIDDVADAVRES